MNKKSGIELIAEERREQIEKHGKTIESDIEFNKHSQLAYAAEKLCVPSLDLYNYCEPQNWSEASWEKMCEKSYKDRLIIAGALIAAEIDRIQNLQTP